MLLSEREAVKISRSYNVKYMRNRSPTFDGLVESLRSVSLSIKLILIIFFITTVIIVKVVSRTSSKIFIIIIITIVDQVINIFDPRLDAGLIVILRDGQPVKILSGEVITCELAENKGNK